MNILNRMIAFTLFVVSASVTAFILTMLIRLGSAIPPAKLRIDALISASSLGIVVLIATAGARSED